MNELVPFWCPKNKWVFEMIRFGLSRPTGRRVGANAPHRLLALRSVVDAGDVLTTVRLFGAGWFMV